MSKKLSIGDIRVVIGTVLGIIGVFLLVAAMGTTSPEELAKSGGIHANLWAGITMVAVAAIMAVWAIVSPEGGKSPDVIEAEHHRAQAK